MLYVVKKREISHANQGLHSIKEIKAFKSVPHDLGTVSSSGHIRSSTSDHTKGYFSHS